MSVLKVIFGVLLREVREPKLCTKFEVANFNGCRNNYGTTSEGISTLTTSSPIHTSPLATAIPHSTMAIGKSTQARSQELRRGEPSPSPLFPSLRPSPPLPFPSPPFPPPLP